MKCSFLCDMLDYINKGESISNLMGSRDITYEDIVDMLYLLKEAGLLEERGMDTVLSKLGEARLLQLKDWFDQCQT